MCENGIYMNIPDYGYLLNGGNKVGIGYREVNWSLPRERQLVLGRQVMYDGLWERLPSMCWTFVPLTQYHGGGAAAQRTSCRLSGTHDAKLWNRCTGLLPGTSAL